MLVGANFSLLTPWLVTEQDHAWMWRHSGEPPTQLRHIGQLGTWVMAFCTFETRLDMKSDY